MDRVLVYLDALSEKNSGMKTRMKGTVSKADMVALVFANKITIINHVPYYRDVELEVGEDIDR